MKISTKKKEIKEMGDFALKLEPSDRITYIGKKLGEEPCPTTLKITNPTSVHPTVLLSLFLFFINLKIYKFISITAKGIFRIDKHAK